MTIGERLAKQYEKTEADEAANMTALQRRQRRRLEYMEVRTSSTRATWPGRFIQ